MQIERLNILIVKGHRKPEFTALGFSAFYPDLSPVKLY